MTRGSFFRRWVWSFFLLTCPATPSADPVRFVDATAASGIVFRHVHGGTGKKYFVETMGSGCAFLDYNSDGRLDIFAVNGGALPGYAGERPMHRLYRNEGDGRFTDVTDAAGVGVTAYGMGCCAGDYDNDGDQDLYVTCYGPNSLFRNNGDGTFTDVARKAGVAGDSVWSVGCAFLDYDNDGCLDLYVGNYVDYSISSFFASLRPYMGSSAASLASDALFYPHPDNFRGVSDRLYHNNGDSGAGRSGSGAGRSGESTVEGTTAGWTFTDVTERAGVFNPSGKAMGLVCGDYDDDGDADIFVANDMTPDFLYRNRGDGTFEDVGLLSGVAYSGEGNLMSSMGADFGDYDGDGRMDLAVTHFQLEGAVLYHNEGNGLFSDVSSISGIKRASYPYVHWGVHFLDYDNNGWVDLLMVNGHVLDNAELVGSAHAQPPLLFRNGENGKFLEVTQAAGLSAPRVSRGAAFGDYDDDGDVDVFIINNNAPATLLRNDGGNQNHWIRVKLVGGARKETAKGGKGEKAKDEREKASSPTLPFSHSPIRFSLSNRDGIGARVWVWAGGRRQVKEVRSGSSYLSQNDFRLHFGLGPATRVDSMDVRWPGGTLDRLTGVAADRQVTVSEGETKRQ